jgi:hypothetical protein
MTAKGSNPKVLSDDDIDDFYKKKEITSDMLIQFYSNKMSIFNEKSNDYDNIINKLEILKERIDNLIEDIDYEKEKDGFDKMVSNIYTQLRISNIVKKYKSYKYNQEIYLILGEEEDTKLITNSQLKVTLYLLYKDDILYILKNEKDINSFSSFSNEKDLQQLTYDLYKSDKKVTKLFRKVYSQFSSENSFLNGTLGGRKTISYKLNSDNVKLLHNNKKHRSIKEK